MASTTLLTGFDSKDFDVFTVPGLEPRMKALIERVRPKLHTIGDEIAPFLATQCGEEIFPHVAKHARRTINPPKDTWVAWSPSKRGYKAFPHFQVGLWATHAFIQFAIIYECTSKQQFAERLEANLKQIRKTVPDHFFWSPDHMQPVYTPHGEMTDDRFAKVIHDLKHVKKAEVVCGLRLEKDDPALADGAKFLKLIENTIETLMPVYRISI